MALHQQHHQAAHSGFVYVHPARGFARAPFDMAFTRPTPPCGG